MRIIWQPVPKSDLFSEQMASVHSPEYGHIIIQIWITAGGDYTTRISAPGCRPVQRILNKCSTVNNARKHAVILLNRHFPEPDTPVSDDCINKQSTVVQDINKPPIPAR